MERVSFDQDLKEQIDREEAKCIGCKACMKGCPMLDDFTDNPKDLLIRLKEEQNFTSKLPYSCMLCSYCHEVCPKDVSFKDIFFKMRTLTMDSKARKEVPTGPIRLHQAFSFSKVFTAPIGHLESDTVFFPGCALQGDNPDLVKKIYHYLRENLPGIGYWSSCCGKPTHYIGDSRAFEKRLSFLKATYKEAGVKRIVTACQNCTRLFEDQCPDIEVLPVYSIISDKLPPSIKDKYKDKNLTVNVHDPCPIRDHEKLQEDVRRILDYMGISIVELDYTRSKTLCCGSGGSVPLTRPDLAERHRSRRAGESDFPIVTYCKECVSQLGRDRQVLHILDLIFLDEDKALKARPHSGLNLYLNRFKAKGLAK